MTKKITKLMLNGEEYEIREYQAGWQPGANTIAYYPLTSTTTVNDMSGNGNHGTMNGTITFGSGLGGVDCGSFPGSSSTYINVPNSSDFATTTITYSFWIASSQITGNRGIIYKGPFSSNSGTYYITNYQNFGVSIDETITYATMFDSNNQWVYVVVSYDGSTVKIYKNGTLNTSASISYDISLDGNPLKIGAYWNSNYCFYGYMSNLIIENKERTAQEIQDYYNQTCEDYGLQPITPWAPNEHTLAYLKLENNTNDSSGNSNNGTGTDITYSTLSSGKKVASFNGSSSKIDFSSTLLNNGATSGTISIWTYGMFNAGSGDLRVMWRPAQSDGNGDWLDVYADGSQNCYRFYGNNNNLVQQTQTYSQNTWKLLTITLENGTFYQYINGTAIGSAAGTWNNNGSAFSLGYRTPANDRFWYGYMSDFIIEDRARTAQDIANYYNQTKGDYGIS